MKVSSGRHRHRTETVHGLREYNALDRSSLSGVIEESFRHFSGDLGHGEQDMYADLYEIMQADGKVDQAETSAGGVEESDRPSRGQKSFMEPACSPGFLLFCFLACKKPRTWATVRRCGPVP